MPNLRYGKRAPFLIFSSNNEFYEVYGFLCNIQKHHLAFQWEYNSNSGAWGNEGRIHFLSINGNRYSPVPLALEMRLTAGRGSSICCRVNCNDFIKCLVSSYGFTVDPQRPGSVLNRSPQGLIPPANPLQYVPQQYKCDYYRGFNM